MTQPLSYFYMQLSGGTDDVVIIASFNASSVTSSPVTSSSSLGNISRCEATSTSELNGRLTPQQSKGAADFNV